ncbi:HNH endonuclease [Natronomonas amylolytica]|uniref:HNH endonuclease n=1 Tax=Natronomonas amylolytica TaxID=3108498 RepID=UPI0030084A12
MSRNNRDNSDGEVVPIGVLLVGAIVGGYLIVNNPLSGDTAYVSWILTGLSALGVLYVAAGFRGVYQKKGLDTAVNWLFGNTPSTKSSSPNPGSKTPSQSKTPPPSESLKNELYFERANRECEWCGEHVDSPDIHHIKPRAEGGPNDPENLIVLCPNCHRKADGGTISRSKLKYRVDE